MHARFLPHFQNFKKPAKNNLSYATKTCVKLIYFPLRWWRWTWRRAARSSAARYPSRGAPTSRPPCYSPNGGLGGGWMVSQEPRITGRGVDLWANLNSPLCWSEPQNQRGTLWRSGGTLDSTIIIMRVYKKGNHYKRRRGLGLLDR